MSPLDQIQLANYTGPFGADFINNLKQKMEPTETEGAERAFEETGDYWVRMYRSGNFFVFDAFESQFQSEGAKISLQIQKGELTIQLYNHGNPLFQKAYVPVKLIIDYVTNDLEIPITTFKAVWIITNDEDRSINYKSYITNYKLLLELYRVKEINDGILNLPENLKYLEGVAVEVDDKIYTAPNLTGTRDIDIKILKKWAAFLTYSGTKIALLNGFTLLKDFQMGYSSAYEDGARSFIAKFEKPF